MPATFHSHTFPNGLTVNLKEMRTAPLVSQWLWLRVGSRNEQPGQTGASHWVEHMLFRGTPRFPGGVLDRAISRQGGYWNAMTFIDWTTYFETMPAADLPLILEIEADRLMNAEFAPEDVEAERTIIISERQGMENDPVYRLSEAMQHAAFETHSYRHDVIGELEDLQKQTRDGLYQHYRSYYSPRNAVLTLAGDLDVDTVLKQIEALYGDHPAGEAPPNPHLIEAPILSERRVEISGPGETTFVKADYRAPAASHPDFFAFMVLDSLLTGPSNLNLFGGGISNKTSRLYQALVEEQDLAVTLSGGQQATIDPFLYDLHVTVHPEHTPEEIISALDAEIKRVQDAAPPAGELARAVKQARALFAYGSESITNQAFWLGFAEMFANYDWFLTYLEGLETVTPADVQRIAQEYLKPEQRVLGIYLPNGEGEVDE